MYLALKHKREIMTGIYEFMSSSPYLTFFLALILAQLVLAPFRLVNRWIRHRNIVAQGWPPAHLDADGDYHEKEDDND